jgi:hypothetical protein
MPNFNGTGPEGNGPLTGRRKGNCRDKESLQIYEDDTKQTRYGQGNGSKKRGRKLGRGHDGNRKLDKI